jgi:hypothetical protein
MTTSVIFFTDYLASMYIRGQGKDMQTQTNDKTKRNSCTDTKRKARCSTQQNSNIVMLAEINKT